MINLKKGVNLRKRTKNKPVYTCRLDTNKLKKQGKSKEMKKILKITLVGAMVIGSYFFGTTQAKTEIVPYIPDGYIALDNCIPLEDIACSFIDQYDYPCFELKDVKNQLDDPENRSYTDIMESLDDGRSGFYSDRR